MRAAIICEGKSDAAVITNILKGVLNIDRSDVQYLVPELEYDETDLHEMAEEKFSNWTLVKKACKEGDKIHDFLGPFESERFVVIHLDTDVRLEVGFEVNEPQELKSEEDLEQLHHNVAKKLEEWLGEDAPLDDITFAIAIQEIDAWVLPIYDAPKKDTGLLPNPKERLKRILNKKLSTKERTKIFGLEDDKYEQYHELTKKAFRKEKELKKLLKSNLSLNYFYDALKARK
jgi:hypothetical protein